MYIGLRVKYRLFFSQFNEIESSRQIFEKHSNTKFHEKSVQWEPSCSIRTDGRTYKTKLIVTFRSLLTHLKVVLLYLYTVVLLYLYTVVLLYLYTVVTAVATDQLAGI